MALVAIPRSARPSVDPGLGLLHREAHASNGVALQRHRAAEDLEREARVADACRSPRGGRPPARPSAAGPGPPALRRRR